MSVSSRLRAIAYHAARSLREAGLLARPVGFAKPADTASERRRIYERDGFVLGTRLLDNARMRVLRDECDRTFAQSQGASAAVRRRSVELDGTVYHCLYDLHLHSDAFDQLLRDPELIAMLTELTGVTRFRVLVGQVQAKPARVGGLNGWHRDTPTFPLIRPFTGITAWISLDDATDESGGMRFVPQSHQWGEAWDIAEDWGLPSLPKVYHGNAVRTVSSPVPAGYVHFHHELVWHSSGTNRTPRPRRAFAVHYVNADARHSGHALSEYRDLPIGAPISSVLPIEVAAEPALAS